MKKTHPKNKPATEQDVRRAFNQGVDEGTSRAIRLMLYILIDKHDAPMDDIQQLGREIEYYADSIKRGFMRWKDIDKMLDEEYNLTLEL